MHPSSGNQSMQVSWMLRVLMWDNITYLSLPSASLITAKQAKSELYSSDLLRGRRRFIQGRGTVLSLAFYGPTAPRSSYSLLYLIAAWPVL